MGRRQPLDAGKVPGVALGHLLPRRELFGEDLQLGQQDGGLKSVEAAVQAKAHIVVFVAALAVYPDGAQQGGQIVVVGEDGPAVPVAAQRLGGEKARGGRMAALGAMALTVMGAAETLGRVFQHQQIMGAGHLQQLRIGRGLTEQVHGDDRSRRQLARACRLRERVDVGILPEDLPHVFDRYYRSRKDQGKVGSGLGLSITKAILQQHGFSFGVSSTPGHGATFWFEMRDTRPTAS